MKIYTRTGDRGETGLFGGGRVPKDHLRVEAYGSVDELNSALGWSLVRLRADGEDRMVERLLRVQSELFSIGSLLASPAPEDGGRENPHIPRLDVDAAARMENWMDEADAELRPLRVFVLPGGTEAGARLHLARAVCRRAERRVVALARDAHVPEEVVVYLNRLSDLLFTLARLANARGGVEDVPWNPRSRGG
jgi:cob(I)alamin adenosyltransferase